MHNRRQDKREPVEEKLTAWPFEDGFHNGLFWAFIMTMVLYSLIAAVFILGSKYADKAAEISAIWHEER